MPLPESRNTDYAPGVQVKSADLNEIQDSITTFSIYVSPSSGYSLAGALVPSSNGKAVLPANGDAWGIAVPVLSGRRLLEVIVHCFVSNAGDSIAGTLHLRDAAGVDDSWAIPSSSGSGAQQLSVDTTDGAPGEGHLMGVEALAVELIKAGGAGDITLRLIEAVFGPA